MNYSISTELSCKSTFSPKTKNKHFDWTKHFFTIYIMLQI